MLCMVRAVCILFLMDEALEFLRSHGGRHQRAEFASSGSTAPPASSHTLLFLKEAWAIGDVSAVFVGGLCSAVAIDHNDCHSDIKNIGGYYDRNTPNNMHRFLISLFCGTVWLPKPIMMQLPLVTGKGSKEVVWQPWPLLAPTHMWEAMSQSAAPFFHEQTSRGAEFWAGVLEDDPKLHNHDMLQVEGWQDIYKPVVTHGDGGTYTKTGNSLNVFSWSCLSYTGDTWDAKIILTCLPKLICCTMSRHGVDTLNVLYQYLAAFFNAWFAGVHLEHDPVTLEP
jgi:hypothetical protein